MGSWQTTDSDLPRVTINNLPSGKYKATFTFLSFTSNGNHPVFAINDGSTTCEPISTEQSNAHASSQVISCTFSYSNSGNRVFELYTGISSNTSRILNSYTNPRGSTKFILEYFGSSSVYTSTNADTDWASCGHTTSSFTGFGTVSNIETQCKRQGGDLLMKGKFTSGVSTAVEARISLPIWNGVQLSSEGTTRIPSIQQSGLFSANIATTAGYANDIAALIEPSVTYFTIRTPGSSSLTKANGSAITGSPATPSFNVRIPVSGWQNSNIIIGQFKEVVTTPNVNKPALCSAKISSTGVISNQKGGCFASCTNATTPVCTFTSNYWVSGEIPNCWHKSTAGWFLANATTTTTTFQGVLWSSGAAAQSGDREYFCHGERQ
jgi:hypothetical protein